MPLNLPTSTEGITTLAVQRAATLAAGYQLSGRHIYTRDERRMALHNVLFDGLSAAAVASQFGIAARTVNTDIGRFSNFIGRSDEDLRQLRAYCAEKPRTAAHQLQCFQADASTSNSVQTLCQTQNRPNQSV